MNLPLNEHAENGRSRIGRQRKVPARLSESALGQMDLWSATIKFHNCLDVYFGMI